MSKTTIYERAKLAIGIPSTERTFLAEFSDSFFSLARPMRTAYIRPKGSGPLDHIRNELVQVAQRLECTHLWMADTDQVYPQDTLIRLMAHDLPVVASKVHRRYEPYDPILLRGTHKAYKSVSDEEWKKGGLIEVDATGCGSILYKMEIFTQIEYPWYKFVFDPSNPIGEDVYFCQKLREAGIKIFVDCDAKVGHMGMNIITEEAYWAYKFSQNKSAVTPTLRKLPRKANPNIKVEWEGEQSDNKKEG